jgi:heme-degrading monooxygenase HmoA
VLKDSRNEVDKMPGNINVEWLREKGFDDKYYTQVIFVNGTHRVLDSWTDEEDIMDIESRCSRLQQLELRRYYTPSHARWINDDAHKEFRNRGG